MDGVTFVFDGAAKANDTFYADPLNGSASSLRFLRKTPSEIAAALPLYVDPATTNKGTGEVAINHLLHQRRTLTRWHEEEDCIRLQVLCFLQEGREFGAGERRAQRVEHLAPGFFEALLEEPFRINAGGIVRDQRNGGLDAILRGPF